MPTRASAKGKYSPTKWGTELLIDLECPSGQLCQVRRPGITGLIKAGVLDSLDALTGIVQTEHIDKASGHVTEAGMKEIANDKAKLLEAVDLADKVTCYVVVQPQVLMNPENDEDREPGRVYVDQVDMIDKMFIFQYVVGGVSDLAQFREEFGATLGSVEAG